MSENSEGQRRDVVLRRLGERVRAMRRARGMSIASLALTTTLSEEEIRTLEAGQVAAPMDVLITLADAFAVGVADLFGDSAVALADSHATDAARSSPHVIPSPVLWGGDLPPAPWLNERAERGRDAQAPPVAPAPTAGAGADVAAVGDGDPAAERTPPALGQGSSDATPASAPEPAVPTPPDHGAPPHVPVASVAPRVHRRAAERGMHEETPYVFVAPDAPPAHGPRTFADLRTGSLAGRTFGSMREFAVASVREGNHALPDVARVFRVPVWRLEQWVRESGHAD